MEQSKPTYIGSEITDAEILDKVSEDYRRLLNPVKWQMLRLLNRKSDINWFNGYIPSKYTLLPEYRVAGAI